MAEVHTIRTPWNQQFRRIRYQLVPVVVFGIAVLATVWLWAQHAGLATAVGEAEVARLDITAPANGVLAWINVAAPVPGDANGSPGRQWEMFDTVTQGQILARLDDATARASLATLRKTIAQLQMELVATEAEVRLDFAEMARDQADQQNDMIVQLRRLAMDVEELRMEVLDREAAIETDKLELQRQQDRYEAIEKLANRGQETQAVLWDVRLERDVVKKRIETNESVLTAARTRLKSAQRREATLRTSVPAPTTTPATIQTFLDPIRAAIAIEEARMEEVRQEIKLLTIRAPFDGMIRDIFRRPGQAVRLGEPVLTLIADESPHVVTYVREHHRIGPRVGMSVNMRVRTLPVRNVDGHIAQIGPQVVRVPRQQLRDPDIPEWGLPVRIALPEDCGIRPGEIVDITFHLDHKNP